MAQDEDGQPYPDQPYPERSQAPDMQGAGMPAISSPSVGLLAALGGAGGGAVSPDTLTSLMGSAGGAIPNAAILGMMGQPPSQLGTYAAALSGGISAMRGKPDPVQEIQQNAQKQQNAIALMMSKMQERQDLNTYHQTLISDRDRQFRLQTEKFQDAKDAAVFKRSEASLTAMRGILDKEDTPASVLAVVGPQYAAKIKEVYGVDVPDTIVQRTMKPAERDSVLMDIQFGLDPELILKNHPALTQDDLQKFIAMKDDPRVLEHLKLKSPQDREEQTLRIKGLSADLLEKQHPELRLDPKTGAAALVKAKQLFPGQDYHTLSDDQQTMVYKMAVLEQREQVLQEYAQKEAIQARARAQQAAADDQRRLAMLPQELQIREKAKMDAARSATVTEKPAVTYVDEAGNLAPMDMTVGEARDKGYHPVAQKELDVLNNGQQAMLILKNLQATVGEMKERKLFVDKSGIPGIIQGLEIGAAGKWGDPETSKRLLTNLETQKGHMIILMRKLGDKGVQSIKAMLPAMEAMSSTKGAPAIEAFLGQIESEIRVLGTNTRTPKAFDSTPTVFPRRTQIPPPSPLSPPPGWSIEEVDR